MSIDHGTKNMFAPWRMKYLEKQKIDGCFICHALCSKQPEKDYVLLKTSHCGIILNRYPYTTGHLMIVSVKHTGTFADLSTADLTDMMNWVKKAEAVLKDTYNPDGFNIGVNLGEAAGAGLKDHLHIHIMPRWTGDTNFMTTCGEIRVIPENLSETYKRLKPAFLERVESIRE
jgi:ATP adenylyltransferase